MKTIKLALKYIELNFQREIAYKWDFVATNIAVFSYLASFFLTLEFIFTDIDSILGYTKQDMLIFLVLGQLWWFLHVTFVRKSMQLLAKGIHEGNLDFILLKPLKLQFLKPFLHFDSRHIPIALLLLGFLVLQCMNYGLSFLQILLLIIYIAIGTIIGYIFTAILVYSTFWFGRNDSIFQLIIELPELVKLPARFFGDLLVLFFSTIVPIIIMVNPSYQIVTNQIDYSFLLYTLFYCVIGYLFSEYLWRKGLKAYTSAN